MPKPPDGRHAELADVDADIVSAHAQLRSLWQWRAKLLEELRQDGLPVQLRATYRIVEEPFRPNGPSYRTIARINP